MSILVREWVAELPLSAWTLRVPPPESLSVNWSPSGVYPTSWKAVAQGRVVGRAEAAGDVLAIDVVTGRWR